MLVFRWSLDLSMEIRIFFNNFNFSFRACVESSKGPWEWGVYLINTIRKPGEGLIADIRTLSRVVISKG
jgi:hypothetical protein